MTGRLFGTNALFDQIINWTYGDNFQLNLNAIIFI